MFTLFLCGLVLLVALFTLKAWEMQSNRVLFWADLRSQADDWLSFQNEQVCNYMVTQVRQSRIFLAAHLRQLRNQLSDFFAWLSEQLR